MACPALCDDCITKPNLNNFHSNCCVPKSTNNKLAYDTNGFEWNYDVLLKTYNELFEQPPTQVFENFVLNDLFPIQNKFQFRYPKLNKNICSVCDKHNKENCSICNKHREENCFVCNKYHKENCPIHDKTKKYETFIIKNTKTTFDIVDDNKNYLDINKLCKVTQPNIFESLKKIIGMNYAILGFVANNKHEDKKIIKTHYKKAIKCGNLNAVFHLGQFYGKYKNYTQLSEFYNKSLENSDLNSCDAQTLHELGKICEEFKLSHEKIIMFYQKAIERNYLLSAYNLGNYYFKSQNYHDAKKYYKFIIIKKSVMSLNNLGCVYFITENIPNAIKCFKEAIQYKDLDVLNNLGYIYQLRTDPLSTKLAKTCYKYVVYKKNIDSLTNLGCLYLTTTNFSKFINCYEQVLQSSEHSLNEKYSNIVLEIKYICENIHNIIPQEFLNNQIYSWIIDKFPSTLKLKNIPTKLLTQNICNHIVKNNPHDIFIIPHEFKTSQMYFDAWNRCKDIKFKHIPDEFKTPEICEIVIKKFPNDFRYVPKNFKTFKLYHILLQINNDNFFKIDDDEKTEELCFAFLELSTTESMKNIGLLRFVPYRLRTQLICEYAITRNFDNIAFLPDKQKTLNMFRLIYKTHGFIHESFVPEELKTTDFYEFLLIKYNIFPPKKSILFDLLYKNWTLIKYIDESKLKLYTTSMEELTLYIVKIHSINMFHNLQKH